MAKKDKTRNQSYSGESIASKLLSGTGIGKLLGYGDNTYTDGYGVTRENAPLSESAQGQQLDRMKDTAVNAANLVAATAAENRFDYWQALNNSNNSNEVTNASDVNRYIDAMPDYDLYKNLFLENGYHVAPFHTDYNELKVPEISEEQLKESAEKIRDLLKYVPAVGAAAVLPNTMNKSTNTEQESNN